MPCDVRFLYAAVTAGAQQGPGVSGAVRTRADQATHDLGWLRSPPWAAAGGARSSATKTERSAVSGWPIPAWEGLKGGPLVGPGASRSGLRKVRLC